MEKAPHKSQKKTINSRLLFLSVFFLHYFLLIFISTHYLYMQYIVVVAAARIATGKMGKTTAIL